MLPFNLNGTNVTIEISQVIIDSNNFKWDKILAALVPILTIVASIIIAIYTQNRASKNLSTQLNQQERIMFIQMNQKEITENIKALVQIVRGGDYENIKNFLNSGQGVYIPKDLRNKMKKSLANGTNEQLSSESIQELIDLINDYVT